MQRAAMTHPLYDYLVESRDGHVPDDRAIDDITGLVNDPDLVREVCALFHEKANADHTCYAIGKVYDVDGESFGCVSIVSEDVVGIIGEPIQEAHERINYALVRSYLEFRGLCDGSADVHDVWEGYLDLVISKNFLPFHENGMRAMLIHSSRISDLRLPTVIFAVYQQYDAL
jgi:hypothetical protein